MSAPYPPGDWRLEYYGLPLLLDAEVPRWMASELGGNAQCESSTLAFQLDLWHFWKRKGGVSDGPYRLRNIKTNAMVMLS